MHKVGMATTGSNTKGFPIKVLSDFRERNNLWKVRESKSLAVLRGNAVTSESPMRFAKLWTPVSFSLHPCSLCIYKLYLIGVLRDVYAWRMCRIHLQLQRPMTCSLCKYQRPFVASLVSFYWGWRLRQRLHYCLHARLTSSYDTRFLQYSINYFMFNHLSSVSKQPHMVLSKASQISTSDVKLPSSNYGRLFES